MAKKKIKGIIITAVILAAAGTGGVFGVRYVMKNRSAAVEVTSVATQNVAEWITFGEDEGTQGTVVSDVSQQVQVPDDKVIKEVHVAEGDKVKIGDKLLSYDTTLLELDKELQELTVMELQLEVKSAEADLKKLQNTTPVAKKDTDDDDGGSVLDNLELPDFGDDSDDEARISGSSQEVLMASAQTEEIRTAEAQSADSTPETKQETEPVQDNAPDEPQTAADGVQQAADGTQQGADGPQQAPDGSPSDPDSGQQGADGTSDTQEDPASGEEFIVGEGQEVLTPEDLGEQTASDGTDSDHAQDQSEEDKKGKMNLVLKDFLKNIRIKTTEEAGDRLLADTAEGIQDAEPGWLQEEKIRLVPHFKETSDSHFDKKNTYMMLINGLEVEKEVFGKVYGIAEINGENYPEIGGYTLVQEPAEGGQKIARLTVAFNDGLDLEHEKSAELADAYLEIETPVKNLTGENLVFRPTADEADDIVIPTGMEQTQPETKESETKETAAQENGNGTEEVPADGAASASQDHDGADSKDDTADGEEPESTAEPESGTETETETEAESVKISRLLVNVTWKDGTNRVYPKELVINLYDKDGGSEPVMTIPLNSTGGSEEEGVDGPEETDAPETETEPAQTESETESETGPAQTQPATETEFENPHSGIRTWKAGVEWEGTLEALNKYRVEVRADGQLPIALYYLQNPADGMIQWKEGEEGTAVLDLSMTYQEPYESPVLKLNPLSELTYENGLKTLNNLSGGAYKGSGTKDDPYVFFVTDGVVIRSTFVNWVLGFNEEGTERLKDEDGNELGGYYVRLEIRESDTITGAFIRSIDFDGTILTEYGYGPGTYWIFSSDTGIVRYEEEVDDPSDIPDLGGDPGWDGDTDGETYTAEELAEAIAEKEREIRKLKLEERSAQLKLKNYEKDLEESTVVSAVNGYVKSLGGDSSTGEPYMVVASEGGLYLKTTVSELDLNTVKKGDVVKATSWETNSSFQAAITEINYLPSSTSTDSFFGGGNTNASSYPVLAHIEDTSGLSANEWVSVKFPASSSNIGIYLPKAYIRSENGQSYVYKRDESGRLKKQYVHTAGILSGYVGIKEGLSVDDYIAFPYGKNVKEGAKTVEEIEEIY